MFNLSSALFRAPWWVFVMFAVFAYVGGSAMKEYISKVDTARLSALEAPPPQPIDLSELTSGDIPTSREVNIAGWINFDLNYQLVKTKNGRTKDERFALVLFGNGDPETATMARAAMLLTAEQEQRFFADLQKYQVGSHPRGARVQINGDWVIEWDYKSQLETALEKHGVGFAPGFFVFEPYWDGREAALSDTTDLRILITFYTRAALGFLLIAAVKLFLSRRGRKSSDEFAESPIMSGLSKISPQPTGTTTGAEMPKSIARSQGFAAPRADTITDDSPLGRMHRRDQALRGLAAAADQPVQDGAPSFDFSQKRALPSSGLWEKFKKSAAFVLAAAFLLIWVGRKSRLFELEDAGDIMRWVVTGIIILCVGFGGWFLMTRDDFAGGHRMAKIAIGLGGLFLLVQVQGVLGAPAGGTLLLVVILLSAPILLWSFVISRFVKGVKSGVDKAAAAAVKAKMRTDPFEKLTRENLGPVQSSR